MSEERKDADTGTEDAGTDDQHTDESTDDTDGTEWTPPTREDWDRVQDVVKKLRRELRAAKRPPDPKPEDDGPADVGKAVADATAAEAGKWKPLLVRSAARTAFVEAGLVLPKGNTDAAMARVVKLLDLDDLTISDDGQIDGLREQVEEIRSDFPELFTATNGHRRNGRVDGADKPGSRPPKTAVEQLAAQLTAG